MNAYLLRLRKNAVFSCTVLLFISAVLFPAVAEAKTGRTDTNTFFIKETRRQADEKRILSLLEDRIGDRRLIEKAKNKLSSMSSEEVGLISSLCERVSSGGGSTSADIAFLLVTALFVLS